MSWCYDGYNGYILKALSLVLLVAKEAFKRMRNIIVRGQHITERKTVILFWCCDLMLILRRSIFHHWDLGSINLYGKQLLHFDGLRNDCVPV